MMVLQKKTDWFLWTSYSNEEAVSCGLRCIHGCFFMLLSQSLLFTRISSYARFSENKKSLLSGLYNAGDCGEFCAAAISEVP